MDTFKHKARGLTSSFEFPTLFSLWDRLRDCTGAALASPVGTPTMRRTTKRTPSKNLVTASSAQMRMSSMKPCFAPASRTAAPARLSSHLEQSFLGRFRQLLEPAKA